MKTLIIVTHPNLNTSKVNKRFVGELEKYSDKYQIHKLYELYPTGIINVDEEQKLIEKFDKIVFQFPVYWYNCPPLLKKWFDEVLVYGWAYGSAYKLKGKRIGLCLSTNGNEEDYLPNGKHKFTLAELTNSFIASFNYIQADYQSFFAFYGSQFNVIRKRLEDETKQYLAFIDNL
ncbi:NAD(P)H-dependent oxidoreductase [Paenimyroides ceti]